MNGKKIIIILIALLALSPMAAFGKDSASVGAVYVMSNRPEGNEIVVFDRNFRGQLTLADTYGTWGSGSGGGIDPLGSQGALILSPNKRWLFAVNAGSNDISVFRVRRHELKWIGNFDSGGLFPVSLTFYHNLLYVLNVGQGGDGPNITGFKLNRHGELTPLEESTRLLGNGGFHQVGFSPHGDALVVTKGNPTGEILVFAVDEEGVPDAEPTITPSAGVVPFSFIFDRRGHLLVTEAGSGAVSSYDLIDDNTLEVINASVANGNNATCWIAGTWFGTVFTANTGSNNISTYKVKAGTGILHLLKANAASGNKPIDMAITPNGKFLYVLNAFDGTVGAFRIFSNGNIKDLGTILGLPPQFAQGIAVR
jgi:6-phosphogluconolactonase